MWILFDAGLQGISSNSILWKRTIWSLQSVREKMRFKMVIGMEIKFLDGHQSSDLFSNEPFAAQASARPWSRVSCNKGQALAFDSSESVLATVLYVIHIKMKMTVNLGLCMTLQLRPAKIMPLRSGNFQN